MKFIQTSRSDMYLSQSPLSLTYGTVQNKNLCVRSMNIGIKPEKLKWSSRVIISRRHAIISASELRARGGPEAPQSQIKLRADREGNDNY